jgi:hypothetical protein
MTGQNRRGGERRKCYLSGRLYFNGNTSSLDAVVRNISDTGAQLDACEFSIVPHEFELLIHCGAIPDVRRRAHRVWAENGRMGVAFVGREALSA